VSRILAVTDAVAEQLPECCGDCMFWQRTRTPVKASAKRRWGRTAARRFGPWGRVLREQDVFRGMIQYGPRALFPRTRIMPAGPASADAAVVTCVYLGDVERAGTCERLFLEALADLKGRGIAAVEAYAINYPDEVPAEDRFGAHHTLFDRSFLEHLGFGVVRSAGQVALMRLDLAAAGRVRRRRAERLVISLRRRLLLGAPAG
jgi:hypothetical protein